MNLCRSRFINFEGMCRLCLHEKRILIDIFETTEGTCSLNILQKIKACSTIQLHKGDGLPARICIPCLSSLNAAFDFRIQCENADRTLRDICHVLASEEIINKKTLMMLNSVENLEVGDEKLKIKQNCDFNSIIIVNRPDDLSDEKDTDPSTKVNKGLSKNIIKDDLININVKGICSNNTINDPLVHNKEVHNKELEMSFSVERSLGPSPDPNIVVFKGETRRKKIGDIKKSACPICHKMLMRVNEHIRLLHQNKVYLCKKQNCGAEFLTLKNLQSHQLKCYNKKKLFKCLRCFKEFHRKCNYKAHIVRHSNKKNFKCQLCEKAFVDSTGLRRHFLKHHEPQQEAFISGCCDKVFKTKEGLKQHIQKAET